MKLKSILFIVAVFLATQSFAQETKVDILRQFAGDLITIDTKTADQAEPLVTMSQLAAAKAAKSIELTKENIKQALATAKDYKTAIIIVGRHTIVRITDDDDCTPSGSWGACMPKGTGYIQKGGVFHQKEGYINNIIGVPDGQKHVMYLFDR
jgi:hypothetical protein